ncbi:MAG: hypothetical protein PG981_000062 [Wolbachia endosymbiont of Ctenocephalides orientis wCori]|nr:MAG: hypothetical protein PG981_000062 [Wolbachia endosymbiont of Ctenocephalides orientis wCori]
MIKNISIVSKNIINIEMADKQGLENFIKMFTVLDKYTAARTLFTEEVKIEYDINNAIKLLKETSFTYQDVETVLNHLKKHEMKVPSSVIVNALAAANNTLESKDIAFASFEGSPQFNIRVNKNTFIITPVNEAHLELSSQNSRTFIESIKSEKNIYDCVIRDNTIVIIVNSDVHQVINSIANSLVKSSLLKEIEQAKLREGLKQLAFKDQAFIEYSSIQTINRYPHNHPLRKHESVTKDIENILHDFINKKKNSESAIEQLNELSLRLSPGTPKIIIKTIDKLVKFHFH